MARRGAAFMVAVPLLAGCAAAGGWTKPGADGPAVTQAERDCRALAASAVEPEININQDILASRGTDWRRAQTRDMQAQTMRERTRDRAAAVMEGCMQAKGFARTP